MIVMECEDGHFTSTPTQRMNLHEKLMKDPDVVIGVLGSRLLRCELKIGDGLVAKLQKQL